MNDKPWYWVVSAGADGRDYSEFFLRHGIAFVGDEKQEAAMAEVKVGHRMILKSGLSSVIAAGVVTSIAKDYRGADSKHWLRDFDGWDLPGYCTVQWHRPLQPVPATGFRPGTLYTTPQAALHELAEQIIATEAALVPVSEPAPVIKLEIESIVDHLVREGLSIGAAEDLGATLRRIRRLANYYYTELPWANTREHETRTFLIVPLLLALGWSEQCIKIEEPAAGGRADIALFDRPYAKTGQSNCVAIIETKGFSQGLDYAPEQVKRYGEHFPTCKTLFVSNGYCYKVYVRSLDGLFDVSKPSAYLNLLKPTDRYSLDPSVPGALDVLVLLMRGLQ